MYTPFDLKLNHSYDQLYQKLLQALVFYRRPVTFHARIFQPNYGNYENLIPYLQTLPHHKQFQKVLLRWDSHRVFCCPLSVSSQHRTNFFYTHSLNLNRTLRLHIVPFCLKKERVSPDTNRRRDLTRLRSYHFLCQKSLTSLLDDGIDL